MALFEVKAELPEKINLGQIQNEDADNIIALMQLAEGRTYSDSEIVTLKANPKGFRDNLRNLHYAIAKNLDKVAITQATTTNTTEVKKVK